MISLATRYFIFQQSWFISVVTLIAIVLFTQLGIWQINRAEEKQSMAELIEQRSKQPTLVIDSKNVHLLEDDSINHQNVQIRGQYKSLHLFFLDNKKHQGKAGFEIITPFKLQNSRGYILINRGWVPSNNDRNTLPNINTPESSITLNGRLSLPPQNQFRPGIDYPAEQLGGIWLYLDSDYFSKLADYPIFPSVVLLDPMSPSGFVRHWPEFKVNPGMHLSYALQWFAFAFFALLAYIWLGLKKVRQDEQKR